MPIDFIFKRSIDLTEEDLSRHPLWFTSYEPDELEILSDLGLDVAAVTQALESISYSDDYVFSLPLAAAQISFKYMMESVRCITPAQTQLVGYVTGSCLMILHKGTRYYINPALHDWAATAVAQLQMALNEATLFPMTIISSARGVQRLFRFE